MPENTKKINWKPIAVGAVAAGVGLAAPAVVLASAGFGAGGVVAGSAAATWQASIGNVAAGSLFSALQSAGTAGVVNGVSVSLATAAGSISAGVTRLIQKTRARRMDEKEGEEEDQGEEEEEGIEMKELKANANQ